MTSINIEFDNASGRVLISPARYLAGKFYDFKLACDRGGASYDAVRKTQTAGIDSVAGVVELLREAGFEPCLAPAVIQQLRNRQADIETRLANARKRLEGLEVEFAKRGRALRRYQRDGVLWLATRLSGLLGDEQRLGKTIQVLAALEHGAPVLVVCPANVVENWPIEASRWRPEFKTTILKKSSFRWPAPGEIVVCSHDAIPAGVEQPRESELATRSYKHAAGTPAPAPGTVLVIDEIHKGANKSTARFKSFSAAVAAVLPKDGIAWGLSGTPLRNKPGDNWNVLAILQIAREAFGSRKRFDELHDVSYGGYKGKEAIYGGDVRTEAVSEALRRVMLRREKKDHLDLPPVIEERRVVDIDRKTVKMLDDVCKKLGITDDTSLEQAINQAIESRSGAGFRELSRVRAALATAKIPAMLEAVEEAEENGIPLIVFSAHREPVDVLADREGWRRISGDETPKQRQAIIEWFQAGGADVRGVAVTIGAGSEGVNLTYSSTMLLVDLAWTDAANQQALARFNDGYSQKADILTVIRLVANHRVDDRVDEIVYTKAKLTNDTVKAATVVEIDVDAPARNIGGILAGVAAPIVSGDDLAPRALKNARAAGDKGERAAAAWLKSGLFMQELAAPEAVEYASMLATRINNKLDLTDTQWQAACRLHCSTFEEGE